MHCSRIEAAGLVKPSRYQQCLVKDGMNWEEANNEMNWLNGKFGDDIPAAFQALYRTCSSTIDHYETL